MKKRGKRKKKKKEKKNEIRKREMSILFSNTFQGNYDTGQDN